MYIRCICVELIVKVEINKTNEMIMIHTFFKFYGLSVTKIKKVYKRQKRTFLLFLQIKNLYLYFHD